MILDAIFPFKCFYYYKSILLWSNWYSVLDYLMMYYKISTMQTTFSQQKKQQTQLTSRKITNSKKRKNMKTKYQSYRPRTFKKLPTALCRHKDAPVQSLFSPIKSCYLIKFLIIAMKTQQRTCKSALAMIMKNYIFRSQKFFWLQVDARVVLEATLYAKICFFPIMQNTVTSQIEHWHSIKI